MNNHRYMSTEYGDYKTNTEATDYYTRRLASHVDALLRVELGHRGVLSLAKKWSCPLMWSHYADHHRGLCIEYDMTDIATHDIRPVSYKSMRAVCVSDLVEWKLNGNEAAKKKIVATYFFSKAPQWRYENEWRDLATESGCMSSPARVSAIHFGLRCDYSVITTIVRLYANSHDPVKFFAIRSMDDSFRLARHLIDTGEIEAIGVRTPAALEFKDVFFPVTDV